MSARDLFGGTGSIGCRTGPEVAIWHVELLCRAPVYVRVDLETGAVHKVTVGDKDVSLDRGPGDDVPVVDGDGDPDEALRIAEDRTRDWPAWDLGV